MLPEARRFKRTFVGRRMPMGALEGELLPRWVALPIFASDPLSSVAYATEAGLIVLVASSVASRGLIVPIAVVIAALLAVVVLSYRQTIFAYPNGGGSYVVAKENLGQVAGLVAAASLLTDYVLTAAVSIASGVLAVTSAAPELASHAVAISLAVLVILVVVNLRGVRESGFAFALPTYGFILSIGALVVIGLIRGLVSGWPTAHVPDPTQVGLAGGVGAIVLMRAFASGCSALTGVEAISNGVTAFRRPQARNAASTLMWMGAIAIVLFLGVSVLAWKMDARPSGSVSVLSELARGIFPSGGNAAFGYYLVQGTTALVLALAANTAFQGFPRLAALLAADSCLPRQFSNLGDRLVYSNGILVLALAAGGLIVGFNADVNSLIQLYLLGVFTAFTLSQLGMVRHNWTRRTATTSGGSRTYAIALNLTGGLLTGFVGVIVAATKFGEGAWMVTIAIPGLVLLFLTINRHYRQIGERLRLSPAAERDVRAVRGTVVLCVSALDDATAEALRYVRSIAGDRFQAIHVADASGATGIAGAWKAFSDSPGPLVVLPRDGTVSGTIAQYVRELERPTGEIATVVIPELFRRPTLGALLRGRTALALKLRLHTERDVVVTDVPLIAGSPEAGRPASGDARRTTVLLPMSGVDAASHRALSYALGLGAEDVRIVHVALGADDVSGAQESWVARGLPVGVTVIPSPYRDLGGPLLAEIRAITADPDAVCVVVMPEIISPHRWQRMLHNQRALFIKRLLLFEERVILTSVPYSVVDPPTIAEIDQGSTGLRATASAALAPASSNKPAQTAEAAAPEQREPRLSTEALWRLFEGIAGSAALLGAIFVVLIALRSHLSAEAVGLALILPPLLAALSSRVTAVVMAAVCALSLNFFFIRPYYSFTIGASDGVTAFVVYLLVALTVAVVAGRLRETRAEAERVLLQARLLHDVTLDLLAGREHDAVLRAHLPSLAAALGVDAAATVKHGKPILTPGAEPSLLQAEVPAGRYHAAELAPTGRIVIDAHRRVTREQARVIDALASLLNARGAPLPDEHLR